MAQGGEGFYSHNNLFGSLRHDPVPSDLKGGQAALANFETGCCHAGLSDKVR